MTAALRLPDAFTPGRTSAAAATPTCCCCCSCAVSLVSASVALPSVYTEDLRKQQPKTVSLGRRQTVATLLAFLPWLLVIPLFLPGTDLFDRVFGDGVAVPLLVVATSAALVAAALSLLGGSRTPWRVGAQVALWTAVGVGEFFVALFSLFSGYLLLVLAPAYLFLLVWVPLRIHARYGPK